MIAVKDSNCEEGFRNIELGNYFTDAGGNKCLVTTKENAVKYSNQISVPVYVARREQ